MSKLRSSMVGAIAAAVALTACAGHTGPNGPPPLNVDVAAAKRQSIATFIQLDGQIAPLEQSTLSFQQSGPVRAIYVNEGDRIAPGQLLAQIDPSTLSAQLAQAEATAQQAAAQARGSQVGLPIAKQQNASNLQNAKAALDNAKLVYDQDAALFKQGYVSQSSLQLAQSQYQQAVSAYNAALVGQQGDVVTAQTVKASQANAAAAQAQARVLRTELAQTNMVSPFEGVVTARLLDPGAMAGPATPVLQVARLDTVWVNINVPDEDLGYVIPGTKLSFVSSSLPGKSFAGKIDSVNSVPTQGTLSYRARMRQANPGDVLRGGMLVTATIEKQHADNAVVVPRTAIAQTQNGNVVYIVQGTKAKMVPVNVGLQTDTLSQIESPLVTPGTQVIVTRPDALQDGSTIAVDNGAGQGGASAGRPGGGRSGAGRSGRGHS